MSRQSADAHDLTRLRFTVPVVARALDIMALLERAWPEEGAHGHKEALAQGRVRVNERLVRDVRHVPDPGALIELDVQLDPSGYGEAWAADELARGEGWFVVERPVGMVGALDRDDPMSPILYTADMLGADRATFTPAWDAPVDMGGPWLCAPDADAADALRASWRSGAMMMTFTALVPRQERAQSMLTGPGGVRILCATIRNEGGISEVQLIPQYGGKGNPAVMDPVKLVRVALSSAGSPILGDRRHGGAMVEGGLRLRVSALVEDTVELGHSWPTPPDWWPDEPVFLVEDDAEGGVDPDGPIEPGRRRASASGAGAAPRDLSTVRDFMVSDASMGFLERGHPWVIEDRQTSPRAGFEPGEVVRLRTRRGKIGPYALVEGPGEIAARVWGWEDEVALFFDEEVDLRVDEALVKRAALLRETDRTDLFRLIHGEADGFPGFWLDRVGPLLRATVVGHTARAFKRQVYENLVASDPHTMIIEIAHLDDVRTHGLPTARVVYARGDYVQEGQSVLASEDGLRYRCEPWEGIDVGFFADQRENRRTLRAMAGPGQRWLNLFGHTGAFNVALAREGAHVINVDISSRYLDWTAENVALNHIDASLSDGAAMDARTFMDQLDGPVDGIILDPPTAARSDDGFWSIRKSFEPLLETCLRALKPGGVLLVCRNARRKKPLLEQLVRDAAQRAGRRLRRVEEAPPAPDYPRMDGFPEGDKFEGLLVVSL